MQVKTSDLSSEALDWAVWKIEHCNAKTDDELIAALSPFNPSSNWAQAGPIIEREQITISWQGAIWVGSKFNVRVNDEYEFQNSGPTALVAAMRCYIESKLGDVVEVPNELVN